MCRIRDGLHVDETPEGIRVLHDEAGRTLCRRREVARRNFDDFQIRASGVGADGAAEFEIDLARDHDLLAAGRADRHEGGLGDRGSTLVHGRVRDFHREQLRDERLVFEDRLERALADLGLVGRVRGQELAAQGERRHGGRDVSPLHRTPEEEGSRSRGTVLRGERFEVRLDLELGHSHGQAELRPERVLGDRGEQIVDALDADTLEHRRAVGVGVRRVRVLIQSLGCAEETRSRLAVSLLADKPLVARFISVKLSATSPRRRRRSRRCGNGNRSARAAV